MIRLLTRTFEVPVALPVAWRALARVEEWPRWAGHIRRVDVDPPGPIGPRSSGTLHLRGGLRSTFRMREYRENESWKWVGPFLWLTVHYDHRFEAAGPDRTRLTWVVDADGLGSSVLGRVFAAAYARKLDRAIPAFVSSLGQRRS